MAGKKKEQLEAAAAKLGWKLQREEGGSLVLAHDSGTGYRFSNEQDARDFLAAEAMRQRA